MFSLLIKFVLNSIQNPTVSSIASDLLTTPYNWLSSVGL